METNNGDAEFMAEVNDLMEKAQEVLVAQEKKHPPVLDEALLREIVYCEPIKEIRIVFREVPLEELAVPGEDKPPTMARTMLEEILKVAGPIHAIGIIHRGEK